MSYSESIASNKVIIQTECITNSCFLLAWAGLGKAGLRQRRVRAKFEFKYKGLKNKLSLIHFVYNLMIGSSKKNRENYPRK